MATRCGPGSLTIATSKTLSRAPPPTGTKGLVLICVWTRWGVGKAGWPGGRCVFVEEETGKGGMSMLMTPRCTMQSSRAIGFCLTPDHQRWRHPRSWIHQKRPVGGLGSLCHQVRHGWHAGLQRGSVSGDHLIDTADGSRPPLATAPTGAHSSFGFIDAFIIPAGGIRHLFNLYVSGGIHRFLQRNTAPKDFTPLLLVARGGEL